MTAKNEFRVAEVEVNVVDADGVVTESGQASVGWNGVDWRYKTKALPAGGRIIYPTINKKGKVS